MEAFFRTHRYLIEHTNAPVRRTLMDEIDWSNRMIGIKGTRGVGKTTFLLQYAKEHFDIQDKQCLYINMNNFFFQGKGIAAFAGEFYRHGGRVLLIDQVFKQPDWSSELRKCYDLYPNLKIVFTGSSVMRLKDENPELNGIVKSYNLRGFSFREFINLLTGNTFHPYTLDEILSDHERIIKQILPKVSPNKYFQDYIHHGFYPFFQEQRNYSENLLKTMNMMTEVDILLIKQIELKYLTKIKKLFYMIAEDGPSKAPNVSKLAHDIETSRPHLSRRRRVPQETREDHATQLQPDVRHLPHPGGQAGGDGDLLRQFTVERPQGECRWQRLQLPRRREAEVPHPRREAARPSAHLARHHLRPL